VALSTGGSVIDWRRSGTGPQRLATCPPSIKTLKQINDLTDRLCHRAFGVPCVVEDIVVRQHVHGIPACRDANSYH
jgi:hypothetical protein